MPIPVTGDDKLRIIRSSGEMLSALESQFGVKQAEVVNDLIENTCWSTDKSLRGFVGGHGTDSDRLAAILNAIQLQERELGIL